VTTRHTLAAVEAMIPAGASLFVVTDIKHWYSYKQCQMRPSHHDLRLAMNPMSACTIVLLPAGQIHSW